MMRLFLILLLSSILIPICPSRVFGFEGVLGDNSEDITEDEILAILGEEIENDFQNLVDTCRIELRDCRGVDVPAGRGQEKRSEPYGWQWDSKSEACKPVGNDTVPVEMTLNVPTAGVYRLWLRFRADTSRPHPITVDLQQGEKKDTLTMGEQKLISESSKQQEKARPIRFEDEAIRSAFPMGETWIWEYRDVDLTQGAIKIEIRSADKNARATTVLLTRSKSFLPNLSPFGDNNTLRRMYYRFKVLPAASEKSTMVSIPGQNLGYHWRFIPRGSPGPIWYSTFGALGYHKPVPPIVGEDGGRVFPVKTWTQWIDVTFSGTGAGPWATAALGLNDIQRGKLEVQLAWYPNPGAILKTITPGIEEGRAVFMMPLSREVLPAVLPDIEKDSPVWGMVQQDYLDRLETASDVHLRHLAWAEEAEKEMGLSENHPRPRLLRLISGCGATPAARPAAVKMLVRLGINTVEGVSETLCRENGIEPFYRQSYSAWGYPVDSHDPCDPAIPDAVYRTLEKNAKNGEKSDPDYRKFVRSIKLGDEIGPVAPASKINASRDCLAHFHKYLTDFLKEKGLTPSFFGVEAVEELRVLSALAPNAGNFERRLYYHSELHKFALSADFYRHTTEAARKVYPNAHTYANFSPGPITLGSQTMNGSEWFYLTRQGGSSMAWGEDWAWVPSGQASYHVSYYAAWVECAARRLNIPAGFYNVINCRSVDHKMISLVSRGVKRIRAYEYGPRYAGAEGSNFWSENKAAYGEILRAACVLGPADEILAEGVPEPRRVALLYNRTHEIMSGGSFGGQPDRIFTFTALGYAHHNADIILVEDLTSAKLVQYKVLYLNGFNLPAAALPVLKEWVTKGGTLVGAAGSGMKDEYGNPLVATEELFGARQCFVTHSKGSWRHSALAKHEPVGQVTLRETALTPSLQADVAGSKVVLEPTTAEGIATWKDGSCAATLATVGKGQALLFGFMPGILYKGTAEGNSRYIDDRLDLVVKPAKAVLGVPSVEISAKQVEVSRFDHESGIAVTLNNYRYWDEYDKRPVVQLAVKTDRKVISVAASLAGERAWKREGDLIVIELPLPESVDVVVLHTAPRK